jgi:hypothetical protein
MRKTLAFLRGKLVRRVPAQLLARISVETLIFFVALQPFATLWNSVVLEHPRPQGSTPRHHRAH